MGINKRDIHELLGNLPFSCDSYWVLMGAAMVLHGIKKETNDIDLGCTDELFTHLQQAGYPVTINRIGKEKVLFSDAITIYRQWEYERLIRIDDFWVCDINTIVKNKRELARKKDLVDLQLIALHQGDGKMG